MQALSRQYPVEWGILIDTAREGIPLFPDHKARQAMQRSGLRLSAHVCGELAQAIAEGRDPDFDFSGYSRVQINHGRAGSSEQEIQNCYLFGVRNGVRPALQSQGVFPNDGRADWLYDVSFGNGVKPATWPPLQHAHPFCGFSGGIGPASIKDVLQVLAIAPDTPYWLDMESSVRTDNQFDLSKCRRVCEVAFQIPA
ncbi:hypothetical protein ACO0LD_08450 [Undibacterium sp. Ji83W]|uniref:hypothetical protein n=1 Tax=Undibacterium sp. Ji83W TaxID=3413043 RepID=UPI003BF257F7